MDNKSESESESERGSHRHSPEAEAEAEVVLVFPPRMMGLRVLLVESDDSTRLLIAALLRKCSYKVVAVSDGLKAWETLKARPQNIDLILTEVDLPSISGYALLTLIMEHHICKRIPVIMTSSQDSISLVLRCTLRGAADFLVKPIRKNELRNLWQHVWRRQTKNEVPAVQNTMGAQHKVDASCDKKAGNDLSSSNVNGGDKRKEESLQLIRKSVLPTSEIESKPSGSGYGSEVISRQETNKSTVSSLEEDPTSARSLTSNANECPLSDLANDNISGDTYRCTHGLVVPSAAIDYISKFEDYPGNVNGCSDDECGVDKLSFVPHLELSLKRPFANSTEDERTAEQPRLNRSNASAFSRYDNGKTMQSLSPAMGSNCGHGTVLTGSREDPMTRDGKIAVLSLNTIWHNYTPPKLHTRSGLNTNWEQNVEENDNIDASENGVRDASPVLEPSSTSSSCSGAVSKLKSSTCGGSLCSTVDNSNSGPSVAITKSSVSKGLNNSYTLVQEGMTDMDSHCPSQREAALHKFRLKRKDRCFDKKVRYQSRKRLAEQRPRVKGQFVRQVKAESSLADGCEYPSRLTNLDF